MSPRACRPRHERPDQAGSGCRYRRPAGCCYRGAGGADSVLTLEMALKFGMTHKALGATIFPCLPTVGGLKLTAQTFDRNVARLTCCAG